MLCSMAVAALAAPALDVDCWRYGNATEAASHSSTGFDLRGKFAGGFHLWVDAAPNRTSHTKCLWVPRQVAVWVAEAPTASVAQTVKDAIALDGSAQVLGTFETHAIVAGDLLEIAGLPTNIQTIPAARKALRPLRRNTVPPHIAADIAAAEPNPVIEDLLRQVSGSALLETVTHLSSYHTRLSSAPGALDAEAWLVEELIRAGFQVETVPFGQDGQYSANVIAKKKGTKYPEELVIAGAHYDSRAEDIRDEKALAPGADDNGSGVAAMLEIAKLINSNGIDLEYTLVLCFFSGEEQGLLGSTAYAEHLADINADVVAMFNADMLGYKLPDQPVTIGLKDRSIAEWLNEVIISYSAMYVPTHRSGLSASCCSDYLGFHNAGFPAAGFFENTGTASQNPHYHKKTDTTAEINLENLEVMTRAIMASVFSFAIPDPRGSIHQQI